MPLPSYMLQQPSPIESLSKRISALDVRAALERKGSTIVMRNVEHDENNHVAVRRAISLVINYADSARLTIEAVLPSVCENHVSDFEATGFHVVLHVDGDDDHGPHTVLRRAAAR